MNALVHFSNKQVSDMICFSLESQFRIRILLAGSDEEAIEAMKKESGIDVVISDGLRDHSEFFEFIAEEHAELPCIVCTTGTHQDFPIAKKINMVGVFTSHELVAGAQKSLIDLFGSSIVSEDKDQKQFCKIKTELLLDVEPLKADVYIRLSPKKHLKLFQAGDEFERSDYEKYAVKKKIDFLYIEKDQCHHFVSKFVRHIPKILNAEEIANIETAAEKIENVLDIVGDLIDMFGVTKEVQLITKQTVEYSVKIMEKEPRLSKIISALKNQKDNYVSSHSMMLAHVACAIAGSLVWLSEKTFERLTFAAFLHDITLQNQDLAQLKTAEDLEKRRSHFSKEEAQAFLTHSQRAADLAKQFKDIPVDTQQIIINHHERPNGNGFPGGLRHNYIKTMSAIFIVAHDLVQYMYQFGEKSQLSKFLETYKNEYSQGTFKKIYLSLQELAAQEETIP